MKNPVLTKYRALIKKPIVMIICAGIAALIVLAVIHFGPARNRKRNESIMTTSTLMSMIDIDRLSTAEMAYTGIADVYKNEEKKDIQCRVCYSATVKAGVDMNKVVFDFDTEHKIVTATLPEIEFTVTIEDTKSMAVLPANANVEPHILLQYSKEDAMRETTESQALQKVAKENVQATIEGLLYPILKANGYTLVWN